jgi:hypothetical protein
MAEVVIDAAGGKPDHHATVPGDRGQMEPTKDFGYDHLGSTKAVNALWIVLIVTSGICLSTFFACATPFAALTTLAALKLGRRDAITVIGLVWLANQAIGYGLLGYPWTWDSAAWGLAIGASVGLAFLAARGLSTTRPAPLAVSLPFVAAFAAFELGLYVAGFALPGAEAAFSASIVGHVFLINALTICGLTVAYQLALLSGLLARIDARRSQGLGTASYR